jgi:acyl-CoA thioesterase I
MPTHMSHMLVTLVTIVTMAINPANAQEPHIVALGDSNTAGYGVGSDQAFPARLEGMLRKKGRTVRVQNAGVPGDTFGGMLSLVDSIPPGTKLVIVQGGYNDLANGVPARQTVSNLNSILSRLKQKRIKTVVCGFFYKDWDAIGRKLAATHQATFVPGSSCYDQRNRGPDGLHMSSQGYQVVAARLANILEPDTPEPNASGKCRQQKEAPR